MSALPELVPISELRGKQSEVLSKLSKGPVLLTQHGKAAAVMMSVEQYNMMLEALEDLRDALDAVEARREPGERVDFDDYLLKRGESVPAASES